MLLKKDLPAAPSQAQRMDLLRKNMRDINAGILSLDGLRARAEEMLAEPRWQPVPLHKSGLSRIEDMLFLLQAAGEGGNLLQKNISLQSDSTGTYYVRPDVEDTLYPVYLSMFPLTNLFRPIQARGILHPYRIKTGFGAAAFVAETDQIPQSHSTGAPLTAPMAVAATQRGASLLEDYVAAATGGAVGGGVPSDNEREDGITAIAQTEQLGILQGAYTVSGHSGDVYGTTQTNGYYGIRIVTNNPASTMSTVFGITLVAPVEVGPSGNSYLSARTQAIAIAANGGTPDLIVTGPGNAARLLDDAPGNVQLLPVNGEVQIGYAASRLRVGQYTMNILEVPGGLGAYAVPGGSTLTGTAEDIVVMDSSSVNWAWLGQERPIWFQNSFADDRLSNRWLVAQFGGPVFHQPNRIASVRVQQ